MPFPVDNSAYPALASPGRIGSLCLDHRILMGSMHLGLEGDGSARRRIASFYEARIHGGAALVITGGAAVHPAGAGDRTYAILTREEDRAGFASLADAIRGVGGRIALQLFHAGRYAVSAEIGRTALAPSAVESRLTRETPSPMTADDIREAITAFADAARFARDAGFHGVEIMASEGYLLNQFLSPFTNRREDAYGGDLNGRMRASLEVVQAIRSVCGRDFPVIFRMSGADFIQGATTWEETLAYAQALETAGVDALNIGIGWHESTVPTVAATVPRGAFASVAAGIKAAVGIPVIGANRINTPETAADLIERGWLDFVAPARPWLADPDFARKALAGDRRGLNVCIACNQSCLDHVLDRPPRAASCLVNPRAGYEYLDAALPRMRKTVAVVGGGPAGLEAARAAAERGHAVTLFEAQSQLGGQFRMAARVPGKEEFYETLRYYEESLRRLGVDVYLGVRATAEQLSEYAEVILATGVNPRMPDIPGIHLPHVVSYPAVFRGEVPLGRRLVILGAGGIACDLAHFAAYAQEAAPEAQVFLARRGLDAPGRFAESFARPIERSITIVARSQRVAVGVGRTTRWVLLAELRERGVQILRQFAVSAITLDGVLGADASGERLLPADQVVICSGQEPQDELAARLTGKTRVHVVGGARDAAGVSAARAIREAWETARSLGAE